MKTTPASATAITALKAAAETIALAPGRGAKTDSLRGDAMGEIFEPLKNSILLLVDGDTRLCFVAASSYVDYYPFSNTLRRRLAPILGLEAQHIAVCSSHNHSCVTLTHTEQFPGGFPETDRVLSDAELTDFGRELIEQLAAAAGRLVARLEPVTIAWAQGHERRISYNRKGRRADGSTYLMREEDRVLLGEDFNGDIDDHAPVVAFVGQNGKPVSFIVQFTAHPVTAYHPESPVAFGDYAQVACDDLSAAHGNVPVLFFQGCAGDSNSKFFLVDRPPAERVAAATRLGHLLGETYLNASRALQASARTSIGHASQNVFLPFTKLPPKRRLQADLVVIEKFLARVKAGDDTALGCLGLNAARTMSHSYRSKLMEPTRRWLQWAMRFHDEGRVDEAPTGVSVVVEAYRLGDVGIVGLPCEPLLGIGRQIRSWGGLPLTIPVGYINDNVQYVPDAPNVGETDYTSTWYRYTTAFLPYRKPAGDLLARAGVKLLRRLKAEAGR